MPTRLRDFATVMVAVAQTETTALATAQLMRKHHVGALVVVDALENARPVGIVTGRLTGIVTTEDLLELLTRELAALAAGVLGARDREFGQRA